MASRPTRPRSAACGGTAAVDRLSVPTSAGRLRADVIRPASGSGKAPLMVLHGISRNAAELVDLFTPEVERTGHTVVVPHFDAERWPHFQRPSRTARPDIALVGLISHLRAHDPGFRRPLRFFGHSGGAQLAHRFAMLYPNEVASLSPAAAGWYCLPDARMAYPFGLAAGGSAGSAVWSRRHRAALGRFLSLPISVYVGSQDTERDESLRQSIDLDDIQGRTRVERAETYVRALAAAAAAAGIAAEVSITHLPGVRHDVVDAIRHGGLARRVMDLCPVARAATV